MEYEPILETKKRTGETIFVCCFSVAIVCVGIYLLYSGFTRDQYIQLLPVLGGLFFLVFGSSYFFGAKRYVHYRLYADRLEVISPTGEVVKTLWINSITSWSETTVKNGMNLGLYTPDDYCIIQSRSVKNDYDTLKEKLTAGKEKVSWRVNAAVLMRMAVGALLVAACCTAVACHQYGIRSTEIHPQDVTTVGGVKVNIAGISRTGGRSSRDYIRIILNDCPGLVFSVDYSAYHATDHHDYANAVQPGDSLFVDILTEDYKKKITHEVPLSFFDKTLNYKNIDVYGLRSSTVTFLSEDNYNSVVKGDTRFIGFAIYAAIALILGILLVIRVNKARQSGDGL